MGKWWSRALLANCSDTSTDVSPYRDAFLISYQREKIGCIFESFPERRSPPVIFDVNLQSNEVWCWEKCQCSFPNRCFFTSLLFSVSTILLRYSQGIRVNRCPTQKGWQRETTQRLLPNVTAHRGRFSVSRWAIHRRFSQKIWLRDKAILPTGSQLIVLFIHWTQHLTLKIGICFANSSGVSHKFLSGNGLTIPHLRSELSSFHSQRHSVCMLFVWVSKCLLRG